MLIRNIRKANNFGESPLYGEVLRLPHMLTRDNWRNKRVHLIVEFLNETFGKVVLSPNATRTVPGSDKALVELPGVSFRVEFVKQMGEMQGEWDADVARGVLFLVVRWGKSNRLQKKIKTTCIRRKELMSEP